MADNEQFIPEHHRVAIAAAVAAVLGDRAVITGVRRAPYSAWKRSGRRMAVQVSQGLAYRRDAGRTLPDRGVNR